MNNIFKELREERGISKNKLAKDLNISRREVSDWENGTRWPNKENAQKLADYYNVSVYNFLEEFKVTDDPDIAEERLKRYGDEISKIYSDRMRNNKNKVLIAKLADKTPMRYQSKFSSMAILIVTLYAISALVVLPLLNPDTEFGSAVVFTIKAKRIECQTKSCVFRVLEVVEGKYKDDYISLPKVNDTSTDTFFITVINDPDGYRIESYTPITS